MQPTRSELCTEAMKELAREAEQEQRNKQRRFAWVNRFIAQTGRYPEAHPNPLRTVAYQIRVRNRKHLTATATSNGHIVKMPRRKDQYMHTTLPTGPEVA